MNPKVDTYLIEGCGRCPLYQTPKCKVHTWTNELRELRRIVLDCGLSEAFKWSQPCYTYKNNNILIVTALKKYASLSFFKGVLLTDTHDILVQAGANSQAVRQLQFTNYKEIVKMEAIIKTYIYEAIEIEKAGLKVNFKKKLEPIPDELQHKFDIAPLFKTAFYALTPGRQRGYIHHFSQAKQSKTKIDRIEKCMSNIFNGIGLNDQYRSMKK